MKIININNFFKKKYKFENSILILGFFESLHIGHKKIILIAKKIAKKKKKKLSIFTFSNSPLEILKKRKIKYLNSWKERKEKFLKLGIDILYFITFTKKFSKLVIDNFLEQYILKLNVNILVVGFDYTFGNNCIGNVSKLKKKLYGLIDVIIIKKISFLNKKISSSRIKYLLSIGKVEMIKYLLGDMYTVVGYIIRGTKKGTKLLNFPTLNIYINKKKILPKNGVYIFQVNIKNKWYIGVGNLGYNISFNYKKKKRKFEIHIINFKKNIYGNFVLIKFVYFLRKEKKFLNFNKLSKQLLIDKNNALIYCSNIKNYIKKENF